MIIINQSLEKMLEEVISNNPGLSLNLIVNQALEEWLRGSQTSILNRNPFITDAPEGYGPVLVVEKSKK